MDWAWSLTKVNFKKVWIACHLYIVCMCTGLFSFALATINSGNKILLDFPMIFGTCILFAVSFWLRSFDVHFKFILNILWAQHNWYWMFHFDRWFLNLILHFGIEYAVSSGVNYFTLSHHKYQISFKVGKDLIINKQLG